MYFYNLQLQGFVHLSKYLGKHKHQSACRHGHGVESALGNVFSSIYGELDAKNEILMVFLDLSAAFRHH